MPDLRVTGGRLGDGGSVLGADSSSNDRRDLFESGLN